MRVVRIIVGSLTVLTLGTVGAWWWQVRSAGTDTWRTVEVERTDVRRLVTATGTLDAVQTVEVGTQVSGILAEVLVDFNDAVTEGQILARIDTALLDADVASASAKVAEASANRGRRALEAKRVNGLRAREAATEQETEVAIAELAVAEAQLRTAQVALTRAKRNLGYATITSPIGGTVVRRDLDPGQTVNAGLSAPTLFLIAGDLARMQILVAVDESDIGQIHDRQDAEFTVQTWPDRTFKGVVRQVRLQSATDQSVVTYTVVVDVDNPDGALLPGMTATVEFIVGEAKDVLCVANAALRYTPDLPGGADGGGHAGAGRTGPVEGGAPAGAASAGGSRGAGPGGGSKRRGRDATEGTLWTANGEALNGVPVKIGLKGTTCTEVSGDGVNEGMSVVVGVDHTAASGTTSPLQQTVAPRRPGGF